MTEPRPIVVPVRSSDAEVEAFTDHVRQVGVVAMAGRTDRKARRRANRAVQRELRLVMGRPDGGTRHR